MGFIKNIFKKNEKVIPPIPHGELGIELVGHREYIGGLWVEIGKLQFEFLKEQGLKPNDIFIDIACGSLRAGVHLIPYLNKGNYLGIEKEKKLIELGLKNELDKKWFIEKEPEFIISKKFEFNKFSKTPNFAIAQSLFTHLPPKLINLCFKNLKSHFKNNGVFFATYFITEKELNNPKKAHDHGNFFYTIQDVKNFGILNGWDVEIIGNWNHPRNQQIVKYSIRN